MEPKYGVLVAYECKVYYDDIVHFEVLPASVTNYTISLQWEPNPPLPKAISIAAISTIAITNHTDPVNINQSGWNITTIVLPSPCIWLYYSWLFITLR